MLISDWVILGLNLGLSSKSTSYHNQVCTYYFYLLKSQQLKHQNDSFNDVGMA